MTKPNWIVEGCFCKAMLLARISRVMSTDFTYASLVAEAMRALARACGATLTDHATLKPSLAHSARVVLQDRPLSAAVLNAVAGVPSDAIRLFVAGQAAARHPSWEMQSIGRALLVLAEVAFAAVKEPADEVAQARRLAYEADQGGALQEAIAQDRMAFDCALALTVCGSSDGAPLPAVVRRTPPPSLMVGETLFPLV